MHEHRFIAAAALAAAFVSAGTRATAQPVPIPADEDPFAGIDCPAISCAEAGALDGGDVFITLNPQRNQLTVYATDNRYAAGGRVDTLKQAYTVEAHNNVRDVMDAAFMPTEKSKKELPNYAGLRTKPAPFPAGTCQIAEVSPRDDKYGPNMIKTNAVGSVEVVRLNADQTRIIEAYGKREDIGYAIHSNTIPMSRSQSDGCIIVSQEDNKKIAKTIATDRARSPTQKQTLTVQPKSSKVATTSKTARR